MKHTGTQTIDTPRLLLRRFSTRDAEAVFAGWANDAEVTRFLRWEPHKNTDETRALLQQWEDGYKNADQYLWCVVEKSTGTPIGSICISLLPNDEDVPAGNYGPGYCIGRAWWGRGYTTEALVACMRYFTGATGVSALYCCHATENPASGAVMQKAGFRYTHDGTYQRFSGVLVPCKYYIYTKVLSKPDRF